MGPRRRSVVHRLVLVTTVVGVLTGLVGAAVVRSLEERELLADAAERNLAAVERTVTAVEERLAGRAAQLELLATRARIVEFSAEAADDLSSALRVAAGFEQLTLHDRDGTTVAAATSLGRVVPDTLPARDAPPPSTRTVDLAVDRTGRHLVEIAVRVVREDTTVGTLVGVLPVAWLAEDVDRPTTTGAEVRLTDAAGVTVAHRDPGPVERGERIDLAALPEQRRVASLPGDDGPVQTAAAPLRDAPVWVVARLPEAQLLGEVRATVSAVTGTLLAVVVATVVAVSLVGRRLLRPLGPLADAVVRLGEGERGVRVRGGGTGEVAVLADGFDRMASSLEQREDALRDAELAARRSEERLRLVVEGVHDYAIVLLDVFGDVRSWNTGAARVVGYPADAAIGRRLTSFADPDDPPEDPLREAFRRGRGESEGWWRRRDGSRFWGHLVVTALTQADGSLYGYAGILEDLTERRAARQALEQALAREQEAAAELRRANAVKDDFLGIVAHEMRTPLSAIRGAVELLDATGDALPPAERESLRRIIVTHADDLHGTVERVLAFSQLQAGRVPVAPVPLELPAAVERSLDPIRAELADHDLHVEVTPGTVELDPTVLQQVVGGLVTNAARYSPAGSRVDLSAHAEGGALVVRVADRGIGVPPDEQQRIFELFRRGSNVDPSSRGTGIGLSLVRGYVDLVGGEVEIDSSPGQGSVFTVRLPVRPDPPGAAPARVGAPAG